jgi:hypothetical protein
VSVENQRRSLKEWREAKQLTADDLWNAGSGIPVEVIERWETAGEPPAEALPNLISLARALDVPLEQLDLGPNRRGFTVDGYTFILFTRGRDDRQWRARIGAWGWPAPGPAPAAIADRATSGEHASGATAEAALDGLEAELRALIQSATQPGAESDEAASAAAAEPVKPAKRAKRAKRAKPSGEEGEPESAEASEAPEASA